MIQVDISLCDKCGTCISICPENAIVLSYFISIDTDKCILCSKCVDVCPVGALTLSRKDHENEPGKSI